jgi:hypothetical protein
MQRLILKYVMERYITLCYMLHPTRSGNLIDSQQEANWDHNVLNAHAPSDRNVTWGHNTTASSRHSRLMHARCPRTLCVLFTACTYARSKLFEPLQQCLLEDWL